MIKPVDDFYCEHSDEFRDLGAVLLRGPVDEAELERVALACETLAGRIRGFFWKIGKEVGRDSIPEGKEDWSDLVVWP